MSDRLRWVHWWTQPWWWADEQWWPDALRQLPRHRLASLACAQHQSLAAAFDVSPCQPEAPSPLLQTLVESSVSQRLLILSLAQAMCNPRHEHGLSNEQHQWCERTARALRPGQWLGIDGESLGLLKAWTGTAVWERLRLQFPPDRVIPVEGASASVDMPPFKRLDTFWQAVIWKGTL